MSWGPYSPSCWCSPATLHRSSAGRTSTASAGTTSGAAAGPPRRAREPSPPERQRQAMGAARLETAVPARPPLGSLRPIRPR
ncbi:Glycosyl transferase family 8 [Musa troglodytarum]|uniref:Glycosyl transferase family 8 n=1 Tax=Musa troglodytarum TaxID=320322 RepID=A0A9E7HVU8_9LILI|nr:Glycosyl transferase family 8 [Musa troglodytarum]